MRAGRTSKFTSAVGLCRGVVAGVVEHAIEFQVACIPSALDGLDGRSGWVPVRRIGIELGRHAGKFQVARRAGLRQQRRE